MTTKVPSSMISGSAAPAVRATAPATTTIPSGLANPLVFSGFNPPTIDRTSAFDTATGKFQPQVAGLYMVSASVIYSVEFTANFATCEILKNGVGVGQGLGAVVAGYLRVEAATLVHLNGTTDYIQVGAWQNTPGNITGVGCDLSAVLVQPD